MNLTFLPGFPWLINHCSQFSWHGFDQQETCTQSRKETHEQSENPPATAWSLSGWPCQCRQAEPASVSLLADMCGCLLPQAFKCCWEWHSGYNPFRGQASEFWIDSCYCTLPTHLSGLPSLAWPKGMKVAVKQETAEM